MDFHIDHSVLTQFPDVRLGVVVIRGADNATSSDEVSTLLSEQALETQAMLVDVDLGRHSHISVWRDAYRRFGSKPREYPSSVESLAKRVIKDGTLRSISPLVDLYNTVSLRYLLPVGGEDLAAIRGDLCLTMAGENEAPVTVLGKDKTESPYPGEVIYSDDLGTICRRWNWREVARTALSSNTRDAVLVIEALGDAAHATLDSALADLAQLITEHCGGSSTVQTLGATQRTMSIT